MNRLYYGDNRDVLRRYVDPESVDLVKLDSPFNNEKEKAAKRKPSDPLAFLAVGAHVLS